MTKQVDRGPDGKKSLQLTSILTLALIVPVMFWGLFGWIVCLLPMIVFVYIGEIGWRKTTVLLAAAFVAAFILGSMAKNIEPIFLSIVILPSGYVIAHAAGNKETYWSAVIKGTLTLCASLYLFFHLLLMDSGLGILQAFEQGINMVMDEFLRHYRDNPSISPERYNTFEQTFDQTKSFLPKILPALLFNILIFISCIACAGGNAILKKRGQHPWIDFSHWRLPERLIWLLIGSGILSLLQMESFGLNMLLVIVFIYAMQGLSITFFFLKEWKLPTFLQVIISMLLFFQNFVGVLILAALGTADVWFDFRRKNKQKNNNSNSH